jgi:hypothetical protein
MGDTYPVQRFSRRAGAMVVSRHGQDAERLPTEPALVLLCCVRSEAGLSEIVTCDRHGAAIDLDDKAPA